MSSESFELISPLERAEFTRRLQAATAPGSMIFSSMPVIGYVGESSLRLRKRISYRSTFRGWLFATLIDEDGHTRLHCRSGMHPFARVFMVIWFSGVLLIGGAMFIITIWTWLAGKVPLPTNAWLGVAVLPLMLGFGIGLMWFGQFIARKEEQFLIDFLRRTVDTHEPTSA